MTRSALVVDDDPSIQILLSKLLERLGFSAQAASDGVEALAKIETSAFDIVLLDLMMPILDGFSVIERLRNDRPEILRHVILITAYPNHANEVRNVVCNVIAKPFYPETVIEAVSLCAGSA